MKQYILFLLGFYEDCATYDPPLPVDCLIDIWVDAAGCTEDGAMYPERLGAQDLLNLWGDQNQR